jgi:hypothetical protein
MRSGLFLPPFDALADPSVVARLAAEAEEAGWQSREASPGGIPEEPAPMMGSITLITVA